MKAKRIISFLVLVTVIFSVFSGCAADPVKTDVDNYLNNQMPTLYTMNKEIVNGFNAVVGENYTDDATMLAAVADDLVPKANDLLDKAIAIVPATPELTTVHDLFIIAASAKSVAMNELQAALESGDGTGIAAANEMIAVADQSSAVYTAAITKLAETYGWKVN